MSSPTNDSSPLSESQYSPLRESSAMEHFNEMRKDGAIREDKLRVSHLRFAFLSSSYQQRILSNPEWTIRHKWISSALKDLQRCLEDVIAALDGGAIMESAYPGPIGEPSPISGIEKLPQTYAERHTLLHQGLRYLAYMIEDFMLTVKNAPDTKKEDEASSTQPATVESVTKLREQLGKVQNQNSGKSRSQVGTKKDDKASVTSPTTTSEPSPQPSKVVAPIKSDAANLEELTNNLAEGFYGPVIARVPLPPTSRTTALGGEASKAPPPETGFLLRSAPEAAKAYKPTSKGQAKRHEATSAVPISVPAAFCPASGARTPAGEISKAPATETAFVLIPAPEAAKHSEPIPKAQAKQDEAASTQAKPHKTPAARPKSVPEDTVPHGGTLPAQRKVRQAPSYENLTANRPHQPYAMSPTRENAIENVGPASLLPGFTPTSSPSKSRFADRYTPKSSPSASQPASPSSSPRSPAGSAPSSSSRRPQMQQHANTSHDVRSEYEQRTPEHSPRHGSYHGYSSPRQHQQQQSDERHRQSSRDDQPSMSRHESHRSQQSAARFGDDMIPKTGRIAAREQQRGGGRASWREDVAERSAEEESFEEGEERGKDEEQREDARRFRIRDRIKRFFS